MAANKLTAKAVEGKLKPGFHSDGTVQGLGLTVGKSGSKSWVLRYVPPPQAGTAKPRTQGATAGRNKPRAMGLGPFPAISLSAARDRAREARTQIANGIDPLEERRSRQNHIARTISFADAASAFLDAKENGFKNAKHKQQWRNTLEAYAYPIIGNVDVAHIDTDLVLQVLQQEVTSKGQTGPLWNIITESGSRLRGRIENVLAWATVAKYRSGENPARWKGNLEMLLSAPAKLKKVKHHSALPYPEIGAFMAELKERDAPAARALEFGILTATRSQEIRGAKWSEIDFKSKLWTIPGDRMKKEKEHEIPLSDATIKLLESVVREDGNDLVFIGRSKGGGMSENALRNVMERMGKSGITQHGFRSSFREWAGETTSHPREVIEHALAHSLKDKAEAAYQRGTLLPKRRVLMDDWAEYCSTVRSDDNVVLMNVGSA
ncbi:MAG: integrase arm-type DNA-binding domain-containing protein [Pseudomonadota bacterium]